MTSFPQNQHHGQGQPNPYYGNTSFQMPTQPAQNFIYSQSQQQSQGQQWAYTRQNTCCEDLNVLEMITKVVCEFIGSTALVFVLYMMPVIGTFPSGFFLGFTFIGLHQIFGPISGGHFNPAISLAHWIINVPHFIEVPLYIIAQIIGGFAGYGLSDAFRDHFVFLPVNDNMVSEATILTAEAFFSFILTLAYCSTWDKRNENLKDSASVKIGMLTMAISTASLSYSKGYTNFIASMPMMTFGYPPEYKSKNLIDYSSLWAYFVGPVVGSLCAAIFFKFLILKDFGCNKKQI